MLNINHIKINENSEFWDLVLIIGKDYNKLDSFKIVKNIIPLFNMNNKKLINRISELMLDKKALDIKIIDVIGLTSLTDYFINCSAHNLIRKHELLKIIFRMNYQK